MSDPEEIDPEEIDPEEIDPEEIDPEEIKEARRLANLFKDMGCPDLTGLSDDELVVTIALKKLEFSAEEMAHGLREMVGAWATCRRSFAKLAKIIKGANDGQGD